MKIFGLLCFLTLALCQEDEEDVTSELSKKQTFLRIDVVFTMVYVLATLDYSEDQMPEAPFLGNPFPSDELNINTNSRETYVGNSYSTYGAPDPEGRIRTDSYETRPKFNEYGDYVESTQYNNGNWGCLGEAILFDQAGRERR